MSKLLSLYKLCPANNDILGVSPDKNCSSVICTLGKKIVYVIELSTQKNIMSWSTLENFSSKVIYDFKRNKYVAVFSNIYLRFWDITTEDINKEKKIKFHKPIYDIFNVAHDNILVIYDDGTTESLDSALDSRKTEKSNRKLDVSTLSKPKFIINDAQMGNDVFSYVKKVNKETFFCYAPLNSVTLKAIDSYKEIKLDRPGLNVRLMGLTTMYSAVDDSSYLITIWSDKRMFRLNFKTFCNNNQSIGTFHTTIDTINVKNDIAVRSISENCIAIYASNQNEDGSSIILYNMKYKIIQSKLDFKVYLSNFKLWSIHENLYLSMGQHLSVIPFVVTADKLSSMIGSQIHVMDNVVEKEMINEDAPYEDTLEFDENQDEVKGMQFLPNETFIKRNKKKSNVRPKNISDSDEVRNTLDQIYRGDLVVEVIRHDDHQINDSASIKILNNVDEAFPLMSENFECFCMNLERHGCSEIEITNKVVPILLKANRTEDIGFLLKRYNHISEKMLVQILKYLLSCPNEDFTMDVDKMKDKTVKDVSSNDLLLSNEMKKFKDKNLFLSTNQSEIRDVLSIALCTAFDSTTILKHLSVDITLNEMIQLMNYLYNILTTDVLDNNYDMRGNLVEGDDFDLDAKMFEWFKLLLDSHYQQILLSRDEVLRDKLDSWLKLVDDHVKLLSDMKAMRYTLVKIANSKPIQLSRQCNRWYTIEKLELY